MMYAIAKKVVMPARISVFTSVLCAFSLNSFSIVLLLLQKKFGSGQNKTPTGLI